MDKTTVCSNFAVDLKAEYGICKNCGFKKIDHSHNSEHSNEQQRDGSVHERMKIFSKDHKENYNDHDLHKNRETNKKTQEKTSDNNDKTDKKEKMRKLHWSYGGKTVKIKGSWNWEELYEMKNSEDGLFEISIELEPGTYEYIYIVDQEYKYDDKTEHKNNVYGGFNNIINFE